MDPKIKIIIVVFVLIAILYLVNFVVSTMHKMKQKETFIDMQIEDFTAQEEHIITQEEQKNSNNTAKKGYDVRHVILDEVEKFVEDKSERIDVINSMFKDIDSYKNLGKESVVKAVEDFVNKRRKEKFVEKTIAEDAPSTTTKISTQQTDELSQISSKLSQLTSDIDSLYTQIGTIRNDAHTINNIGQAYTTQTQTQTQKTSASSASTNESASASKKNTTIETFVDGYEQNVRSFATYSPL
jgi:hypothetical protein